MSMFYLIFLTNKLYNQIISYLLGCSTKSTTSLDILICVIWPIVDTTRIITRHQSRIKSEPLTSRFRPIMVSIILSMCHLGVSLISKVFELQRISIGLLHQYEPELQRRFFEDIGEGLCKGSIIEEGCWYNRPIYMAYCSGWFIQVPKH